MLNLDYFHKKDNLKLTESNKIKTHSKDKKMKSKKFVVDLFAGCGGLSLGLEKAGFHPVFANELNKNVMASYLMNRQII